MIIDKLLEFADAASPTAANNFTTGADEVLSNWVDLGLGALLPNGSTRQTRDIGVGEQLYLVIHVETTFDSAGDAFTGNIKLQSSATAPAAQGDTISSPNTHLETGVIAQATLVAGYKRDFVLPQGVEYLRYLAVTLNTAGAVASAGAINAFITNDASAWKAYAEGQN